LCSHCEEHPWKLRPFNPDKRSIFSLEGEELCHAYSQQEEDETTSAGQPADINQSTTVTCSEQLVPETNSDGSCSKENRVASSGQATVRDSDQLCVGDGDPQQGGPAVTSPSKTTATTGRLTPIKGTSSKTFLICGGNAAPL
jgi:hypothetical protein